jgi:hypothetical protein
MANPCGLLLETTCANYPSSALDGGAPPFSDAASDAPIEALSECEVVAGLLPGCDMLGQPYSLTFRFTGAGCKDPVSPGHRQGDSAACEGHVSVANPVTVDVTRNEAIMITLDNGGVFSTLAVVGIGEEFVITSDDGFQPDTIVEIFDGRELETVRLHTSCSRPLRVGDEFGSLELVAFNGKRKTPEAIFRYKVGNNGDRPLPDPVIVDDNGTKEDTNDDFSPSPELDAEGYNVGDTNRNDRLDPQESWLFSQIVRLPEVTDTPRTITYTATAAADNCKQTDGVEVQIRANPSQSQ